jgi:hypothetical protein
MGVSAAEMRDVVTGWSAKRQVLGAPAHNDLNEKIEVSTTSSDAGHYPLPLAAA